MTSKSAICGIDCSNEDQSYARNDEVVGRTYCFPLRTMRHLKLGTLLRRQFLVGLQVDALVCCGQQGREFLVLHSTRQPLEYRSIRVQ